MKSIYERAFGDEFDDLHPKVQERFRFVFEYTGSFEVEWINCETTPESARPRSVTAGE